MGFFSRLVDRFVLLDEWPPLTARQGSAAESELCPLFRIRLSQVRLIRALDFYQRLAVLLGHLGTHGLRAAEEVEVRDVMNATHGAVRGASFFGEIFAADVFVGVI